MVATHLSHDIIFSPQFIAVKDQITRNKGINRLKTVELVPIQIL